MSEPPANVRIVSFRRASRLYLTTWNPFCEYLTTNHIGTGGKSAANGNTSAIAFANA